VKASQSGYNEKQCFKGTEGFAVLHAHIPKRSLPLFSPYQLQDNKHSSPPGPSW